MKKEKKEVEVEVEEEVKSSKKLVIDHVIRLSDLSVCPETHKPLTLTKKDIESFPEEAVKELGLEVGMPVFYPKDK